MRGSPSRRRLTGMLPRAPMAAGGRAGRRIHWRAAPVLQPRGAPAAQGSRTHQQRRQTGCSRTVPFTELSRLIGKGTITGISPDSTTIHPPKKGGGVKKKKKKAGLSYSFFSPPTRHSIKRTKPDILFADLANIKAISIVHRSSPKLVKVMLYSSPVKLSFNSYLVPFRDGKRGNWLNLDKVRGPLHSWVFLPAESTLKILDNIQRLIILLNSFWGERKHKSQSRPLKTPICKRIQNNLLYNIFHD